MSIKEGDLVLSTLGWSVVNKVGKPDQPLECYNLTYAFNNIITESEVKEVVKSTHIPCLEGRLTTGEKISYVHYFNNKINEDITSRHIRVTANKNSVGGSTNLTDHVHTGSAEGCITHSVGDLPVDCAFCEDTYKVTYTCTGDYESLAINEHVIYSRENGCTEVSFNLEDKEDVLSLVENIIPRMRKVK